MSFAKVLQQLRKEKKVTQEQLAAHLGVSAQAVSKWENGSYPEGDLIPRLADFFEVSIDFLYGREERNVTVEQRVFSALHKLPEKEYFDLMEKLIWAFQIGSWESNTSYYDRKQQEDGMPKTASVLLTDSGFSYLGQEKEKNFYLFLRDPDTQDGFASWMRGKPKVRKLFSFLAEEDYIEILIYLYSLNNEEYVSARTISQALGIPEKKVEAAMQILTQELCSCVNTDGAVLSIRILEENGRRETVYGTDKNVAGLLFGLFALADGFADKSCGYHMQINNRSKKWISGEREDGRV